MDRQVGGSCLGVISVGVGSELSWEKAVCVCVRAYTHECVL